MAHIPTFRPQFRDWHDVAVAGMFHWLCGMTEEFEEVLGCRNHVYFRNISL